MTKNMSINTYFNVEYGQHEYNSKANLKVGNVPLISSTSVNNGIYGFYDVPPHYKNVISLPRTGSIGESRIHNYSCCIDDNCLVLIPKKKMSLKQLYYAATVLRNFKWRFKYGRQITPQRILDIQLSLIGKINADWEKPKFKIDNIQVNFIHIMKKLDGERLENLFEILKGDGEYYENCKEGKTPLISATSENNGVLGFVNLKPIFQTPAITVERILGKAFVQTVGFVTVPDDIFVLKPKIKFSIPELFFIATLLSLNGWRFSYSLKVTESRLRRIVFNFKMKTKTVRLVLD